MDGHGVLRLTTRADQDDVVIEVSDTGPGMSPEVAARAFEAFAPENHDKTVAFPGFNDHVSSPNLFDLAR